MLTGTAYGIALNDKRERESLSAAFDMAPYGQPPIAPILYIKPRNCIASTGATVAIPPSAGRVRACGTLGVLAGRDIAADDADPLGAIAAVCLAVDISLMTQNYYRPALTESCRDGFLPLGRFSAVPDDLAAIEIVTTIDGAEAHRWGLDRLHRDVAHILRDVSSFMTISAGDLFLIGLAGDAPTVTAGQHMTIAAGQLPEIDVKLSEEAR